MPPKGKTPGCSGCGDCKKIGDKLRLDGTCGLAKCIENLKLNDPELQAAFVKALKEGKLPLAHTFAAAIKKQRAEDFQTTQAIDAAKALEIIASVSKQRTSKAELLLNDSGVSFSPGQFTEFPE